MCVRACIHAIFSAARNRKPFFFPPVFLLFLLLLICSMDNPGSNPKNTVLLISRTLGSNWGTGHTGTVGSRFCWFYKEGFFLDVRMKWWLFFICEAY